MATDVLMPRLSDSMEEGTVLKWLVEEGGEVKRGEPLVEIETDKANMTYEADTDGVLIEVLAEEGDTLPIGEVIARIGEEGEKPSGGGAEDDGRRGRARTSREAGGEADEEAQTREDEARERRRGREPRRPRRRAAEPAGDRADGDGRVKASPVARRMAEEMGVELAQLEGSGPGGRIVKADVEAAAKGDGGEGAGRGRGRGAPRSPRPKPSEPSAARPAPRARSRSTSSPGSSRRCRGGWPSRRPPRRTSRSRSTWT